MKKVKRFFTVLLSLCIMIGTGTSATATESFARYREILSTKTELAQERVVTFSPEYIDSGEIQVRVDIEKQEIFDRGNIDIFITSPEEKIPLLDQNCSPAETITVEGVVLNQEYNFFITQTYGDKDYNYRGFFMAVDFQGELICRSEVIVEESYREDLVQEAMARFDQEQAESGITITRASEEEIASLTEMAQPYTVYAGDTENEPNNEIATATTLGDNFTMRGWISSSSDVDWYKYTYSGNGTSAIPKGGYCNFWLGHIAAGLDYELKLCDSTGKQLRVSMGTGTQEQIYRYWVSPNVDYYLCVYRGGNNYSSAASDYYLIRAKTYSDPTVAYNRYRLKADMSNITYSVDSQLSGCSTYIKNAASTWVNPLNGVKDTAALKKMTLVNSNAVIQFKNQSNLNSYSSTEVLARTIFYGSANLGNDISGSDQRPTANWLSCKVAVDWTKLKTYSAKDIQGTMAHEMGHCFGLAHNNANAYSIMQQLVSEETGQARLTYWPECFDVDAFNSMY